MVRRFGSVSFLAVAAATGIASLQVSVYFNPKELSIDKPVPWMPVVGYKPVARGKALVTARMSVGMPRVGWEVLTSYGGTAPVVLPSARLRDPITGVAKTHRNYTFEELTIDNLDLTGKPFNILLTLRGEVGPTLPKTTTPAGRPTRLLPSSFRMTLDGFLGLSVKKVFGFSIRHEHIYQHNQTDLEFLTLRAELAPGSGLPAIWSGPVTGAKPMMIQIGGPSGLELRFNCVSFQRIGYPSIYLFKVLPKRIKVLG